MTLGIDPQGADFDPQDCVHCGDQIGDEGDCLGCGMPAGTPFPCGDARCEPCWERLECAFRTGVPCPGTCGCECAAPRLLPFGIGPES